MRTIAHLDADCFYVSAERVRDRSLCDKPVGVLGNQGACVIAKSYEMKKAGVKTGEPIWEACAKCPEGIYVKRDFRWYEMLSRRMLEVVREFSPRVEYYSIDEFFFEVEPSQAAAETIRDRLWDAVGVPVTVGIARSKTLAKLVSDAAKPFGALALTDPAAEEELLVRLPVNEITGIASRRAARLAPYGIKYCIDLVRADRALIRRLLTVEGERLWWELNGEAVYPLHTERPPHKMLSRGGSLGGSTADPERLNGWVARNTERLIEELVFYQVRPGQLTVYVMHWDGTEGSHRVTLSAPTARFDLLFPAAQHAFQRAWTRGLGASRMHLIASDLRWPGCYQAGLFEPPAARAEAVAAVQRAINARVGRFALRSGATLPLYDVYRDEAQGYDICDVRGKMCF